MNRHIRVPIGLLSILLSAVACKSMVSSGAKPPQQKLTPISLRNASEEYATEAWSLFDRSTSSGWLPAENELLLTVDFSQETTVSAIKVFGAPSYQLTLSSASGTPLEKIDLSALSPGWNVVSLSSPVLLDSMQLEFEVMGELSEVPELEFWGPIPEGIQQTWDSTPEGITQFLSQDESLWPSSVFATAASRDEMILQTEGLGGGCSEVEFTLAQSPTTYEQAFLSFESWGLLRPSSLDFYWNGISTQEGIWITSGRADVAKRFVIPIDAEKLVAGKNELRACLPSEADGEVVLSIPMIVGIAPTGHDFISAIELDEEVVLPNAKNQTFLIDGLINTVREVHKEALVKFTRKVSPDALLLNVQNSGRLATVGCLQEKTWKSLSTSKELVVGQNLISLSGSQAACEKLKLTFDSSVTLSELQVIGSGAKERVDWPSFVVTASEILGNEAILQGFTRVPKFLSGPIPTKLGEKTLSSLTGRFSESLQKPVDEPAPWIAELSARFADTSELSQAVTFVDITEEWVEAIANQDYKRFQTNRNTHYGDPGEAIEQEVSDTTSTRIFLGDKVGVEVPAGAMKSSLIRRHGDKNKIKVKHLKKHDVPELDPMLFNVTAPQDDAFEFTPHGATFAPAAEVTMPYDPSLFPEGTTLSDLQVYFYNTETEKWEALDKLSVDIGENTIKAKSNHFTTMISGIMAAPESPTAAAFTPTAISSLATANPSAGMTMVPPPSANMSGDANTGFSLWVPPGRGGFSPSIGLSYSSGSGNSGWAGQGWDLKISNIQIDTRSGVPTYKPGEEVRYLLDGSQLVPVPRETGIPNSEQSLPTCDDGSAGQRFMPRTEGAYFFILRCGEKATARRTVEDTEAYHWEVLDRSGTRYFYGSTQDSRLTGYRDLGGDRGGIFAWYLDEVRDIDRNLTKFTYFTDSKPAEQSGEDWRQIYPESILYTSHETSPQLDPAYKIEFVLDNDRTTNGGNGSRKDIMSSGRPGFKVLTRYLLRAVRVRFDGELVRQYLLTYQTSLVYKKTLLKSIAVQGPKGDRDGCFSPNPFFDPNSTGFFENPPSCVNDEEHFFYSHTFDYFTDDNIGFEAPVAWGVQGLSDGLTESVRTSGGFTGYGAISLTPTKNISAGLDLTLGLGVGKENTNFFDINGDGLPDEIERTPNVLTGVDPVVASFNQYKSKADSTLDCSSSDNCSFGFSVPDGDLAKGLPKLSVFGLEKLGLDFDMPFSGTLRFIGELPGILNINLGAGLGIDHAKTNRFMADFNGDGLIDQIKKKEILIAQRTTQDPTCPIDKICYVPFSYNTGDNLVLENDTESEQQLDKIRAYQIQTDAVRRWVAPFEGMIQIDAKAQRVEKNHPFDNGARVQLFHYHPDETPESNATDSFLNDLCISSCPIIIEQDDIDEKSIASGELVYVEAGDEIYLLVGSNHKNAYRGSKPLDELKTSLSITYKNVARENLDGSTSINIPLSQYEIEQMHEPTGSQTYVFDAEKDFRLAGTPPIPFVAPYSGTLILDSRFSKQQSGDNVRICVQKLLNPDVDEQGTFIPSFNLFNTDLPCDVNVPFQSSTINPFFYENVSNAQEFLSAQDEFYEEINIENIKAGDMLIFRVETDFPIDPEEILWEVSGRYTHILDEDTGVSYELCDSNTANCKPTLSHLNNLLQFKQEDFQIYFPQPRLELAEPRDVFIVPDDGKLFVDGQIFTNIPGQELPESIFAIRSEHQLIAKEKFNNSSSFFEIEPFDVAKGQSISFDFLAKNSSDIRTVIHWEPNTEIDGNSVTRFVSVHGYLPPKTKDIIRKIGYYNNPFMGDFHGWSYGAWNSKIPFNPDDLVNTATLGTVSPELLARIVADDSPEATSPDFLLFNQLRRMTTTAFSMLPKHSGNSFAGPGKVWQGPESTTYSTATHMNGGQVGEQLRYGPSPSVTDPTVAAALAEEIDPDEPEEIEDISVESFEAPTGASPVALSVNVMRSANIFISNVLPLSGSVGTGHIRTRVEVVDFDGDGILDAVKKAEWFKGNLFAGEELPPAPIGKPVSLDEGVSESNTFQYRFFAGGAFGRPIINQIRQRFPAPKGASPDEDTAGLGASVSITRSLNDHMLQDVNGDGLPDLISRDGVAVHVQLNLGGVFGQPETMKATAWQGDDAKVDNFEVDTTDHQNQATTNTLRHDTSRTIGASLEAEIGRIGAAFGLDSSMTRTVVNTSDLNGDGLLDLVMKKSGQDMKVQFNTGSSFTDPVEWDTPDWNGPLPNDENVLVLSLQNDINAPVSLGDIIPDEFQILLNQFPGPDVVSSTGYYNNLRPLSFNVGGSFTIPFGPIFGLFGIVDLGAQFSVGKTSFELILSDIDGDGAPDHLLRKSTDISGEKEIFVRHNQVTGKENLLKTVHGPLGSTISIEYQRTPNTVDKPQNRIVLSKVTIDDGHSFGTAQEALYSTPNLETRFSYEDGFYDRNEKEFFGFGTVKTSSIDGQIVPIAHQTLIQTFENRDYALKGSLLSSELRNGDGNPESELFSQVVNEYGTQTIFTALRIGPGSECVTKRHPLLGQDSCDVVFPFLTRTTSTVYEGTQSKTHQETYSLLDSGGQVVVSNYDEVGNLKSSIDQADDGSAADDLETVIEYENRFDTWILGLPLEITVRTPGSSTFLRKREAAFADTKGNLTSITTHIDDTGNNTSTTQFNYNNVGNLVRVDLPANESFVVTSDCTEPTPGGNAFLKYTYDEQTQQYIESVEDAFGFTTSATYDKRFGLVTSSTGANQQTTFNTYDALGRLTKVKGPYDTDERPALQLEYFQDEATPRAVARHFINRPGDYPQGAFTEQSPLNALVTVAFTDGFGVPIQVKTPAFIEVSPDVMQQGIVSQRPSKYDNLGRVVQGYHPFFASGTNALNETAMIAIPDPASTEISKVFYDDKNRAVRAVLPDGTEMETFYAIVGSPKLFRTTSHDGEDRESATFTDGVGRTIKVQETDANKAALGAVTRYSYFPTGEVDTITDAANHLTSFTYDLRGLQLSMTSPDFGNGTAGTNQVTQVYDKNANLIRRVEPNHLVNGSEVNYHYDKNRLSCVDYPVNQDVSYPVKQDVSYQYGAVPANGTAPEVAANAGRVVSVTDETGTQSFSYGLLGEVKTVERELANFTVAGGTTFDSQKQKMKFFYDSYGRTLSLQYPDGESVRYFYNNVGDLSKITGRYGDPFTAETADNARPYIKDLRYDKFGQAKFVRYGNDVTTRYNFEPDRVRLKELITKLPATVQNGAEIQHLSYTYDNVSNPTRVDSTLPASQGGINNGFVKYEYDTQDRLTRADGCQTTKTDERSTYTETFAFNDIHNLTAKIRSHQLRTSASCATTSGTIKSSPPENNFRNGYTYSTGHAHRVSQVGNLTFQYDANGNVTQKGPQTYVWDDDNRMVQATVSVASPASTVTTTNRYDAGGQRVVKSVQKSTGTPEPDATLFYNPYFITRTVGTKNSATKHIFAGGNRVAAEQITYNATTEGDVPGTGTKGKHFFFHKDHLGNSSVLTNALGQVSEYNQYFPDGDLWIQQKTGLPSDGFLFTGKFLDSETGLYNFEQRFYDPKTSLWLGVDPVFTGGPKNLSTYSYAIHNSSSRVDPDGREPCPKEGNCNVSQGYAAAFAPGSKKAHEVEHRKKINGNKKEHINEINKSFQSKIPNNLIIVGGTLLFGADYDTKIRGMLQANVGSLIFPTAGLFLNHYLDASGTPMYLDLDRIINETEYTHIYKKQLNNAKDDVNTIIIQSMKSNDNVSSKFSFIGENAEYGFVQGGSGLDADLYFAVHNMRSQFNADVSISETDEYFEISMNFNVSIYDVYQFHDFLDTCIGFVCHKELVHLQEVGMAKAFVLEGSSTPQNYKWKINKKTQETE